MRLPHAVQLGAAVLALTASSTLQAAKPTDLTGRPLDAPPRIVKAAKLEYPEMFAVENLAFRGSTVVEFIVTENATVESVKITQVSHPAFVPPALEALFKSTFASGTIAGKPVASRFTYLFTFDWEGIIGKMGVEPFTLPPQSSPGIPEEFRYDVAPRPTFTCEPVYPRELLLQGVQGEAKVNVVIGKNGRVVGAKVATMTHPEFGGALVAATEAWRFTAPLKDGKATLTVISREHRFSRGNRDLASDADGSRLVRALRNQDSGIIDVAALDAPPRLLYDVLPQYPRVLASQRTAGEATIEFLIDRRGRARLPHIVSATHKSFGWAAATAVQQRFYEQPRQKGRSVDARVVQTFSFAPGGEGREPVIAVR